VAVDLAIEPEGIMGVFMRKDSPYWWYWAQLRGRVVTGSTDTTDRRLAYRIYLEKHHQLVEDSRGMPRKCEYVFCNSRGRRWGADDLARKAFETARQAAGLSELTFHALHHNFASELVAKGADLRTVQEYMGHSSLTMLLRYAHVSQGTWRSTIQLLGRDMAAPAVAQNKRGSGTTLTLRCNSESRKYFELVGQ
jgi:hypothetical protein